MKSNFERLIISIGIPLLVGAVSGFISGDNMMGYQILNRPPLSPPSWVFPVVWTILFILMGVASYLVYTSDVAEGQKKNALSLYVTQLIVNFFWSIIFFKYEMYLFAFIWLLLLLFLIGLTMQAFYQISKPAAYLLVPYFLWVAFAGYLNLAIYLIN